LESLC
jgi:hypothetical protein